MPEPGGVGDFGGSRGNFGGGGISGGAANSGGLGGRGNAANGPAGGGRSDGPSGGGIGGGISGGAANSGGLGGRGNSANGGDNDRGNDRGMGMGSDIGIGGNAGLGMSQSNVGSGQQDPSTNASVRGPGRSTAMNSIGRTNAAISDSLRGGEISEKAAFGATQADLARAAFNSTQERDKRSPSAGMADLFGGGQLASIGPGVRASAGISLGTKSIQDRLSPDYSGMTGTKSVLDRLSTNEDNPIGLSTISDIGLDKITSGIVSGQVSDFGSLSPVGAPISMGTPNSLGAPTDLGTLTPDEARARSTSMSGPVSSQPATRSVSEPSMPAVEAGWNPAPSPQGTLAPGSLAPDLVSMPGFEENTSTIPQGQFGTIGVPSLDRRQPGLTRGDEDRGGGNPGGVRPVSEAKPMEKAAAPGGLHLYPDYSQIALQTLQQSGMLGPLLLKGLV